MEGGFGEASETKKLYDAVEAGDVIAIQQLLQQDPLLLQRISFKICAATPLYAATTQGHLAIVEEILNTNPQLVEEFNSRYSTALHIASAKGHVQIARKLLSAAPHLCLSRDCQGLNPIHLAAMKGHVEVLEELARTAPVAAMEKLPRRQTVLHLCVKHTKLEALKVLVPILSEFVSEKDDDGETILHLAVRYKQIEIIRYLVGNTNIDKESKNCKGQTPLQILEQSPSDTTTSQIKSILLSAIRNTAAATQTDLPLEWLARKRDAIMVVAILIATMAFEAGVNPAGGVWQDDSAQDWPGYPVAPPHRAGEAIMAYSHPRIYKRFIHSNTVAFVTSLSTILLLISGLPMRNRFFMWVLMAAMWAAISSVAATFAVSITVITPSRDRENLSSASVTGITVWSAATAVLLVGNTLRLLNWWLKSKGITVWRPERFRRFVEVRCRIGNQGV
ncbi:hypothetical protein C2S53_005811 [Perilla frutescens var. hirtella]|uniref:PGG domain-containing protein n=1 Tax=Perilla frutescens var. hirtella TaxID=608512 RepID=A0AAD4JBW6_PERFH|nr:hypothetical protein C2S53_005811 [Perilla frutescens var. hirtella]